MIHPAHFDSPAPSNVNMAEISDNDWQETTRPNEVEIESSNIIFLYHHTTQFAEYC